MLKCLDSLHLSSNLRFVLSASRGKLCLVLFSTSLHSRFFRLSLAAQGPFCICEPLLKLLHRLV